MLLDKYDFYKLQVTDSHYALPVHHTASCTAIINGDIDYEKETAVLQDGMQIIPTVETETETERSELDQE